MLRMLFKFTIKRILIVYLESVSNFFNTLKFLISSIKNVINTFYNHC